jgi:tetraacyldisaccharide 4'-kinase
VQARFHSLLRGENQGLGPAIQRAGLWALSQPYGWAVRGRNWLFDCGWKKGFRAAVPVISVGNLTVGGTGKTPCVEYVARFFRRHNLRVAILSRGYGSRTGSNDEALVLAQNLPDVPHLQGPDRVALAGRAAEEFKSEVLVLDDGFQHRRLKRDLDLVLIDATSPWGHDYLLPRGLLREPAAGLRRANLVLLTRCDQAEPHTLAEIRRRIGRIAPRLPVVETTHRPGGWINAHHEILPLTALRDRPWAAFCGIGNPDAFRRTLCGLAWRAEPREGPGCQMQLLTRPLTGLGSPGWRTFADHHNYTSRDVEELGRWAGTQPPDCVILTTQKDLVKLPMEKLNERPLWALQIELHIEKEAELLEEMLLSAV